MGGVAAVSMALTWARGGGCFCLCLCFCLCAGCLHFCRCLAPPPYRCPFSRPAVAGRVEVREFMLLWVEYVVFVRVMRGWGVTGRQRAAAASSESNGIEWAGARAARLGCVGAARRPALLGPSTLCRPIGFDVMARPSATSHACTGMLKQRSIAKRRRRRRKGSRVDWRPQAQTQAQAQVQAPVLSTRAHRWMHNPRRSSRFIGSRPRG